MAADLQAIREKVRRLTRSPSVAQISTAEIDEYINTFLLYDFPANIKTFTLRKNFSFFTQPNQDVYDYAYLDPDVYINVNNPIYIAGRRMFLTQSQEEFYNLYPKTNAIADTTLRGDGVTVAFAGTLPSVPVLANNVSFTTISTADAGMALEDDGSGVLAGSGNGTIDYITGVYTLTYAVAPRDGEPIISQTIPYQASIPQTVLYFDNKLWFRPIPDQSYKVELEVLVRPTTLIAGASPELEQWWQYIAIGASRKILEDRLDMETASMIMPLFKEQERLILRRTIVQQTPERVATLYTDNLAGDYRGL